MEKTTQVQEMIANFAKANKVSKAKTVEFVEQLKTVLAVKESKPRGRHTSAAILALRGAIEQRLAEDAESMKNVTTKEVAAMFGVDYSDANKTIKYFAELNKVSQTGSKDREAGQRGKKEAQYTFTA